MKSHEIEKVIDEGWKKVYKNLSRSSYTNTTTHLISEFNAIELVSVLEKFRSEGGGDELSLRAQHVDHPFSDCAINGLYV